MTSIMHWLWNGVSRLVRGGFLAPFDFPVLLPHRGQAPRGEGAIFCMHGLGDLLLAGNAIDRLTALLRGRGLRVVLYVNESLIDFAQHYFDVDVVECIDRHSFSKPIRYRKDVLRRVSDRFQIAVQPTYNRMLRVEDCLMRAT